MQEILAPVGNWEMLDAALAAGCDAIYLAAKSFGARAYAANFSLDEIGQIVKRCHCIGVRVHVAMNTILFEDEIDAAFDMAYQLYTMGIDAFIVQDLGLMHRIHHQLPNAVLHASTQMSVMYPVELERLKKLGVSRVVLARECTKEEIEACQKTGLEIEIFVHGAICISMSGRCYLSSVIYGRSGNRGVCAQPCRMKYAMYEDGRLIKTDASYLLSPKDLSLIDQVHELPVDSYKIEGRMKSPVYVFEAVSQLRKILNGEKRSKEDVEHLQQAFHRGYTKGHVYHQSGKQLMNMKTPNHQGVIIGKVSQVKGKHIEITLEKDLEQHDGIRIGESQGGRINFLYDKNHKLQNRISAGSKAYLEGWKGIRKGDLVRKTISYSLEKVVEEKTKEIRRKVPVQLSVTCEAEGHPLTCRATDGTHRVEIVSSQTAQRAKNQGLTEQRLCSQLNKTKDSWVEFTSITCDLGKEIFFPIAVLNDLRRRVIAELEIQRTHFEPEPMKMYQYHPPFIQSDSTVYDRLEATCAPSTMNVTNSYGVAAIQEMGFEQVILSDELQLHQVESLMQAYQKRYAQKAPAILTIYQHRRLMIMRHCPVNTVLGDGRRQHCNLCHKHRYTLKGMDGKEYLLKGNADCFMQIFDKKRTDLRKDLEKYQACGISSFYVSFFDESKEKKQAVIESIASLLD